MCSYTEETGAWWKTAARDLRYQVKYFVTTERAEYSLTWQVQTLVDHNTFSNLDCWSKLFSSTSQLKFMAHYFVLLLLILIATMSSTSGYAAQSIKDRLKPDTTVKVSFGGPDESPRFIIGYWSIRGLCAPLRMMLSAAKVNHWVVLYDVVEEGESSWSKEPYVSDKNWLRLEYNPLMNLPFLVIVENDDVVCQTNAIFTFLGRGLNFLGSNKHEESKCEELLCELMDLRNVMVQFAYGSDGSSEQASKCVHRASDHFRKLEHHLTREYPDLLPDQCNKESTGATRVYFKQGICHLVGGKFSAPDFHFYELLDQFCGLCNLHGLPDFLDNLPYVTSFYKGFGGLEDNCAYRSSFLCNDLPYNNPYAKFGSDPKTLGSYVRNQSAPWRRQGVIVQNYGSAQSKIS